MGSWSWTRFPWLPKMLTRNLRRREHGVRKKLQLACSSVRLVYACYVFKVFRSGFSSAHQVTPEFVSRLDLERTLKGHEVYSNRVFLHRASFFCNPNWTVHFECLTRVVWIASSGTGPAPSSHLAPTISNSSSGDLSLGMTNSCRRNDHNRVLNYIFTVG